MHYQLHSCTGLANDVGGVENHIALAITAPCLSLALDAVLFDDCALAYWRQLKLADGICNWLFVSLIPQ